MEVELGPKVEHDRPEADRGAVHQHEFARDGDRPFGPEAPLYLPSLAPAVGFGPDAVGKGADAVVDERRIDEARPDVEDVDHLAAEVAEAPGLVGVDDALAVLVLEAVIEVDHPADEARAEHPDAAEIEEIEPGRRLPAVRREHRIVPEMRVAVDDAEAGERVPPGLEQGGGDPVAVGKAVVEEGEERLPLKPGHGEEALRRQGRNHLGHADQRLLGKRRAIERDVARLAAVVELLTEALADLRGDERSVDLRAEPPLEGEEHAELGEVGLDRRFHVRVLELAGEHPPVGTGGAVDLAEGGGGGRDLVEGAEVPLPVEAELGLHPPADEGRPHRRRRRLEFLQLRRVFGRQQVRHRREELGDLHQRALEAAEGGGEAGGIPLVGEAAAEEPGAGHLRRDAPTLAPTRA